jgi:hypothetical protein
VTQLKPNLLQNIFFRGNLSPDFFLIFIKEEIPDLFVIMLGKSGTHEKQTERRGKNISNW